MRTRDLLALFGFLALTLAAGFAGGQVTAPNIAGWYAGLAKPSFNPPDWVFAPVWTALYVLMAVAAWRVWRRTSWRAYPLALWQFQLALNVCWSFIFFGLHAVPAALAELVLLWAFILATFLAFRTQDRWAGWLLAPYLAWVGFAGVLNYEIWRLNG